MAELKPGRDCIGVSVFGLVFNQKKEFLLIRTKPSGKKTREYDKIWSMPGGTIEMGETAEEALKREIKEEVGLKISDPELLCYNDYIKKSEDRHWLSLNFKANTSSDRFQIDDKAEVADCKWFTFANVPTNISPFTQKCLALVQKEIKAGRDYIGVGCGVFITNKKGEVILQLRSKNSKNEAGKWEKMGGSIEYGETVEQTLRRESLEESGVEITDIEFLSYTDHILKDENQHWLGLNFMALVKDGQVPKNMELHKHDDLRWFKFSEVPDNLAMPTKESLSFMVKSWKEKYGEINK